MPERSTISQIIQIGVEATPGTAVAASKRLQSLTIDPDPQFNINTFRPAGQKYSSLAALNQEWMSADLGGVPTYTEIVYPLSSVLTTPTISQIMDGGTPTGAYRWVFDPLSSSEDSPKTFTIEQGSAVRAHRFTNGIVTDFGIDIARDNVELNGTMIGRAIEDGVSLTGSPTFLALEPVLGTQIDVFLDTTSAGLGTTKLARLLGANWNIGSRFNPLWVIDSALSSFVGTVETPPDAGVSITHEADAQGMGMLNTLRAGTTMFMRIQAKGGTLYSAGVFASTPLKYELTIDCAVKVNDGGGFSDEDGVFAVGWGFTLVHDGTWGKALHVEVVNKLAAL